jgi:hypothetical protein|tara:strand:+ start:734 stop:1222 length:489 start_codon:yes stop_codon:yes gene_type:complete
MVNEDSGRIDYHKLLGWALLLVGGAGLLWNGWITGNAFTTRSWNTTVGMVYSSEIEFATASLGATGGAFYSPDVTYRYQIAGTSYSGHSIYYSDQALLSFEAAQRLVDRFPTGEVTTVYYNPGNPEETVLLPGPSPLMWMLFAPAILFLVMGQRIVLRKRVR